MLAASLRLQLVLRAGFRSLVERMPRSGQTRKSARLLRLPQGVRSRTVALTGCRQRYAFNNYAADAVRP